MSITVGVADAAVASSGAHTIATTGNKTTQASGSCIFVFTANGGAGNVASVSDVKGNTFTRVGSEVEHVSSGAYVGCFICPNAVGGSGYNVTLNLTSTTVGSVYYAELIGAATASPVDVENAVYLTTGGPFSCPITTTNANDYMLGFITNGAVTTGETFSSSLLTTNIVALTDGTAGNPGAVCGTLLSATGSYNPNFSDTAGNNAAVVFSLGIKAAASGGAALAATPSSTTAATGTLGLKHVVADLVFETTTTTGTGALSLAGAVTGYRTFASVMSDQDTCLYLAQAVTGGVPNGPWEIGIGTFNAGADTLSRTKVLRSSNSNALVSFAAGITNVVLTEPAAVLWNKGVFNVGNSGSAITIDWANGPYQMVTLTAACTITFANSMLCPHGELEIYQDATGGRVPTITGAVYRSGSAPTWSTTNATHDTLKINYNAVTGASNVFALT